MDILLLLYCCGCCSSSCYCSSSCSSSTIHTLQTIKLLFIHKENLYLVLLVHLYFVGVNLSLLLLQLQQQFHMIIQKRSKKSFYAIIFIRIIILFTKIKKTICEWSFTIALSLQLQLQQLQLQQYKIVLDHKNFPLSDRIFIEAS